jgi:PBP1b-binding outer membrane lipoprotein LpoB
MYFCAMKYLYVALFIALFIGACGPNAQQKIAQKWQVSKVENPRMEKMMAQTLLDIDTMTAANPAFQNNVNIDSFKSYRKQLLAFDKQEQEDNLKNLSFDFKANKIVYITTLMGIDSAIWTITDNQLSIDGPALTGIGAVEMYTILSQSNKEMVWQNSSFNDTVKIFLKAE